MPFATLLALVLALCAAGIAQAQTVRPVSLAEFDKMMTDLSNWGRWGAADELGALNLITPAKRKAAAKLVRDGVAVSMSHAAVKETAVDNPRPFVHEMRAHGGTPNAGSHGDSFTIAHHGLAHTHMDALCHYFYKDKMYNGVPRATVTALGAEKLSIDRVRNGLFTRGVLVDLPKMRNVPYLEPGTPIYSEDLDAWEKFAGIKVQPGDALLIRTGRWAHRAAHGPSRGDLLAGLHVSAVRWLKARDIAVLGSDSASEARPAGVEGVNGAVHTLVLVALGVWILDNCDFEDVSRAAAERKRWEFLMTASPLRVEGATGSALNPIAMF